MPDLPSATDRQGASTPAVCERVLATRRGVGAASPYGPPQRAAADTERKESAALDTPATYLNWNFILISIPNLLMILGMIALFVVALLAPFPGHDDPVEPEDADGA